MTEYAPQAIENLFAAVKASIPSAQMGGIIGDAAHTYGYHRGRNYLPSNDYSVQYPPDRQGDGEAACALDISWSNASDQYTVSQRLLNAKNDSRMAACREFYGSTDGRTVIGWDYYEGHSGTSDDSHLWHVHLSILRAYSNDDAAMARISEVITGKAGGGQPPEDELPEEVEAMLVQDASSGIGMLVTGGKAIFVRSGDDYNKLVAGGLPAAKISKTLFDNIAAAMGGARG
jgi:hypothetical protein